MNYVYDILVNLNEEVYDFYDWEETDNFVHVRRVPIYRVGHEDYLNLSLKKIKLSDEVLSSIKDKTQVFSSRNIEVIPYSLIVSDEVSAIMIEVDEKGYTRRKSKFLVNEEMEILDVVCNMKISEIKYNVVNNRVKRNVMIRSEKKVLNNILKELDKLKDDEIKIDYLYYEWFNTNTGVDKYEKLVKGLKASFTARHMEFLELLNLLTIKK